MPHALKGFEELVQRCEPARLGRPGGRVVFAFEATGHFWEAVAHFLAEHGSPYVLVNPLATFRVREARQIDRDKRDVTDAEQIADLLRTGMVTADAARGLALRRRCAARGTSTCACGDERARLKTLVKHQLYGAFPEFVTSGRISSRRACWPCCARGSRRWRSPPCRSRRIL